MNLMTFLNFTLVLIGASTLSSLMMRVVYWLDHPPRRTRRAAAR